MSRKPTIKFLTLLVVMIASLAAVAVGASAHGSGSRADADGDGASDRCEARAGTDPAVADTDGNGVVDGLEDTDGDGANNAAESKLRSSCVRANTRWRIRRAEVVSYTDGVLTLSIGKKGGLIAKPVSSRAVILLPDVDDESDDNSVSISRRGGDDGPGDDRRGRGGDDGPGDDHGGRGRGSDDDDDEVSGTTADLTAGTVVRDARVKRGEFVRIRISDED